MYTYAKFFFHKISNKYKFNSVHPGSQLFDHKLDVMVSGYKAISHFRCLKSLPYASPFCCFASLFRCFVSPFRCFVVSQFRSFASPFRCFQSRPFVVSQFRCFVLSLFRTFVVSYFRSFALSLFRTFVVSYSDMMVNTSVCHAGIHFSAGILV